MKVRLGFVSNSSSSSYICEICGEIESGMDASLQDFEMVQCENGHIYHIDCLPEKLREMAEKGQEIQEELEDTPSENLPGEYDSQERLDYYKKFGYSGKSYWIEDGIPQKYCPLCTFNVISNDDLVKFIVMTHEEIFEEIRSIFGGDYQKFKEFIGKNRDLYKEKAEKYTIIEDL